jgi:hypothetical protein
MERVAIAALGLLGLVVLLLGLLLSRLHEPTVIIAMSVSPSELLGIKDVGYQLPDTLGPRTMVHYIESSGLVRYLEKWSKMSSATPCRTFCSEERGENLRPQQRRRIVKKVCRSLEADPARVYAL